MSTHILQSFISSAVSRRGALLATACVTLACVHSTTVSAQTRPTQEAASFSPAQVKAATSALDAHVAEHPKNKASAVAAKTTAPSATAVADVKSARALRTPVPSIQASGTVKKR